MATRIVCCLCVFITILPRHAESSPGTSSDEDSLVTVLAGNHTFVMKLIDKLSSHPHFRQLLKEKLDSPPGPTSTYAGEEARKIKALAQEQIRGYLAGEGMGLARAAELNGYPGPKHVLDLSSPLHLSGPAKDSVNASYQAMHAAAVRLGKKIVGKEGHLDSLFRSGTITCGQLRRELDELGRLEGELRFVHLRAHLETTQHLSEEQIDLYEKLRGYTSQDREHHGK